MPARDLTTNEFEDVRLVREGDDYRFLPKSAVLESARALRGIRPFPETVFSLGVASLLLVMIP